MTLNIQIRGKGPALVLLHGWGFDHRVFEPLATELLAHFTVYLVDLPGFGRSPLMEWTAFKDHLLNALPREFAVSGWSMGGLYAMRLAIEEPLRVTRLMVTASSPHFIRKGQWPGIEKQVFDGFLSNLARDPEQTMRAFIQLQSRHHSVTPSIPDKVSMEALQQGLTILNEWDFREALLHYQNPACFAFGRLDAITPRLTLEVMAEKYPDFHYRLFQKAAHMPFLSHQDDYLQLLFEFLL
ncbi:pimelyl-ACP methyl ester esterase [Legionella taurinensis]|uniref:Pimeloyl-[acyl-carrier protein] methyl ester esterase n=1 Tax=Legionella taurinensis TaxID=70611 RepID=A0AB38N5Y2_9GAMM|nr:alpha/beta fold hydrolase [Legionella taurinensis]MDX1838307.1 alpha/beta fold hydrolase [Legionella taurinensis]PUT39205.1 pimelyl-ACP methyl ester esterase [Legionella taurinensis]PUT39526.1 pimelyl-ACP methyl ester esterase [Legionella taurinensis]PUT43971.1 pimelyl-ACP methyl ester esterase [Legionella taurinensis]PUT45029.1 pimelyl-ACP methyl ester esterase [Legionella taurinensis]